jgi:hypothetical protein
MPISTSSFDDDRDKRYSEYEQSEQFERETMTFPGLRPADAETLLKRLGGGVAEKLRLVEGIGWRTTISPTEDGVSILFEAHDELLDDLIRRFEEMAGRAV